MPGATLNAALCASCAIGSYFFFWPRDLGFYYDDDVPLSCEAPEEPAWGYVLVALVLVLTLEMACLVLAVLLLRRRLREMEPSKPPCKKKDPHREALEVQLEVRKCIEDLIEKQVTDLEQAYRRVSEVVQGDALQRGKMPEEAHGQVPLAPDSDCTVFHVDSAETGGAVSGAESGTPTPEARAPAATPIDQAQLIKMHCWMADELDALVAKAKELFPCKPGSSSVLLTMKIQSISGLPDDSKAPFVVRAVADAGCKNASAPSQPKRIDVDDMQDIVERLRGQKWSSDQISQVMGLPPNIVTDSATDEADFSMVHSWERIELSELVRIIYKMEQIGMSCGQIADAVALPERLIKSVLGAKDSPDSVHSAIAKYWGVKRPCFEQWEETLPWNGETAMVFRLEVLDAESLRIGNAVVITENLEAADGVVINGPFQVTDEASPLHAAIALHGCVCVKVQHLPEEKQSTCNGPALTLAAQAVLLSKMKVKFGVTNDDVTNAIQEHDAALRESADFLKAIDKNTGNIERLLNCGEGLQRMPSTSTATRLEQSQRSRCVQRR